MLKLKNISKTYKANGFEQKALDDITLKFDNSGLVVILGQSGSGKTTLLNIIGGLDQCDDNHGELEIDNIVTKKYSEKDWNAYRNHKIGFIFQNYNLIAHQTVLKNVELALTISGIRGKEKTEKAKLALESVGITKHLNKYPNQLSGGQAQRVAIARAIVNDPSIILADEPTGALDSKISLQIMKLLKDISNDRLVIMVTHNKQLAKKFADRIITIEDGHIISDNTITSNNETKESNDFYIKNTSMSMINSIKISLDNLKTKKTRTLITSFAGSLGVFGVATILSISSSIYTYIDNMQKNMLLAYPINIESESIGIDLLTNKNKAYANTGVAQENGGIASDEGGYANSFSINTIENNLVDFKEYLDNENNDIYNYIGDNGIVYNYKIKYGIYTFDDDGYIINIEDTTLYNNESSTISDILNFKNTNNQVCSELMPGRSGEVVSDVIIDNYDLMYGRYPEKSNELLLNINDNGLPYDTLYSLGFITYENYINSTNLSGVSYENIMEHRYYLLPACDILDNSINKYNVTQGIELRFVGVVKRKDTCTVDYIKSPVAYTKLLTNYVIDYTNNNELVKKQKQNKDIDVFTHRKFESENKEKQIIIDMIKSSTKRKSDKYGGLDILYDESDIALNSYERNMEKLGAIDIDNPYSIQIYTDSFKNKNKVAECIEEYNLSKQDNADKIIYSDYIGLTVNYIRIIISAVSFILVSSVGMSLIVSSIMVGIITYISVLERTKEIGILRALGASRYNVATIFNVETFCIGLLSGTMGIIANGIVLIQINTFIKSYLDIDNIAVSLPFNKAIVIIGLNVLLTMLSGFIPTLMASKKNTINALNSG